MADSTKNSKADKIAAARKKLKEFKTTKNKKEKIQQHEIIESTENITNAIPEQPPQQQQQKQQPEQQFQEQSEPTIHNSSMINENYNITDTPNPLIVDNTKINDDYSKIMEQQPTVIQSNVQDNINNNNTTTNLPFFNQFSQNSHQSSLDNITNYSDNVNNNNNNNNNQQQEQQQQNPMDHFKIPTNLMEDFAKRSANIESLNQLSDQINNVLQTDTYWNVNNYPTSSTTTTTMSNHHQMLNGGLEQRNQDLAGLLSQEKIHNQELNGKLMDSTRTVESLQLEMEKLKFELTMAKQKMEIDHESSQLKEQLQVQIQTVGILVSEKSELMAALTKYQSLANAKVAEVEELQGRLTASRHRVQELEKANTNSKSIQQKLDGSQLKLCSELENVQDELKQMRRTVDEQSEEIIELKQRLLRKSDELIAVQCDADEKRSQLNMAQLKIDQLTSGDLIIQSDDNHDDGRIERLTQETLMYQQQIRELQVMIQQLGQERDQSSQQYQTYVQHLNKETTNLAEKLTTVSDDNRRLAEREENLVKHIGDLERQIQQQMIQQQQQKHIVNESPIKTIQGTTTTTAAAVDVDVDTKIKENTIELERFNEIQQTLEQRTQQCLSLQLQLQEKLQMVTELETKIERIESECKPVDTKNLFATIESDKLTASRAVSQNQELKQQLDEIQKAYIQLSNDKLELTNKLQSEQHLGREIKLRFNDIETELQQLKDRLHFKDEEMIRLTHENTELNKQILGISQELDQLRHYAMKSNNDFVLQQKLQYANDEIVKLRKNLDMQQIDAGKLNTERLTISNVEKQAHQQHLQDIHNHDEHEHNHDDHKHDEHDHDHGHGHSHSHSHSNQIKQQQQLDQSDAVSISSTINIATNEAMEKLQQRFTRTMAEIADLTEEKQRLEHLVMQLHGETETIGEYIALYQTQRRLLKQREIEKDIQLQRIASDREEMQEKLLQLNHLVEDLLLGKPTVINDLIKKQENINNSSSNNNSENDKQHTDDKLLNNNNSNNEIQIIEHDQSITESSNLLSSSKNRTTTEPNKASKVVTQTQSQTTTETATKILTLLSDIKEKNLKFTDSISSEINHHCPCCSGQLQTV